MAERRSGEAGSRDRPDSTAAAAASAYQASRDLIAGKMREGFGGLVSRAGESAERLRETARGLTRTPLLQQAVAARERGNLEAAFWLLREAFADDADEPGVAVTFWDVSVELDRADAARAAATGLVEHHATARETELAIQYWDELVDHVPDAFISPAGVARILPELTAWAERQLAGPEPADDEPDLRSAKHDHAVDLARRALRGTLDPNNTALTPGLALRLAEEGRALDFDAACEIARVALASPELHEAKRARLAAWVPGEEIPSAEIACEEASDVGLSATPGDELTHSGDEPPRLVLSEDEIAAAAARLRERQAAGNPPPLHGLLEDEDLPQEGPVQVLEAFPLALEDDALVLRMGERRQTRVPYTQIEALAAAEIARDDKPAIAVIDLALNWSRRDREPLRLVRLRTNTFDPKSLVPDCASEEALSSLLAELLERSHAVPLPDPESALGLRLARFESIEDYEAQALGLD